MKEYFAKTKAKITPFLESFFALEIKKYRTINPFVMDVLQRLSATVLRGKMIRGGLVYLAYSLNAKKSNQVCRQIATAMEVVHSGLIIHDDIMDSDGIRRGEPTIHKQYEYLAKNKYCTHPATVGISLGICAGDVAIFEAFKLISTLPTKSAELSQICDSYLAAELTQVAFAQMQDVYIGANSTKPTIVDILNLYKFKTARYTFSLPLFLGSIAAGQPISIAKKLEKFGEHLGIIFQIIDDEIGVFGDASKIGKAVGSDIREGKKTLYHYFLFKTVNLAEKKRLNRIFGNQKLTSPEIDFVRNLINKYEISKKINQILNLEVKKANRCINEIRINSQNKKKLLGLLKFNLERKM